MPVSWPRFVLFVYPVALPPSPMGSGAAWHEERRLERLNRIDVLTGLRNRLG